MTGRENKQKNKHLGSEKEKCLETGKRSSEELNAATMLNFSGASNLGFRIVTSVHSSNKSDAQCTFAKAHVAFTSKQHHNVGGFMEGVLDGLTRPAALSAYRLNVDVEELLWDGLRLDVDEEHSRCSSRT